jgi:glycosyltransferase involved in cell wall biosynthesis
MTDGSLIGIDASRSYRSPMTGTERYSRRLIEHLVNLEHDQLRYRLYFNESPPEDADLDETDIRVIPSRRLWTHYRLSRELRKDPVDLLFIPSHVLPIYHPERSIVTIHDLGYLYEPDSHTPTSRLQLQLTTSWNAKHATHLIAISESTRNDLITKLGVDPERISVVRHGIDETFKPLPETEIERYRRAARLPERFVLYLGTVQPRKNLLRLIQAFEHIADGDSTLELILAGRRGWMSEPIRERARISQHHQRIRFLGHVPDEQLPMLYGAASVVTLPSLYEGFGLPVLEAMACGTPVVMSNRGALPELSGADAEIIEPTDIDGMARALRDSIARRANPQAAIARTHHASQFSWADSAWETRRIIHQVLSQ